MSSPSSGVPLWIVVGRQAPLSVQSLHFSITPHSAFPAAAPTPNDRMGDSASGSSALAGASLVSGASGRSAFGTVAGPWGSMGECLT